MKKEIQPVAEKNEIIVYQPEGGEFHIEVRVENETVWLTQAQMAELFATDRTSINKHIRNIFQTQELDEKSTCAKIAQVRMEGERAIKRIQPYYNLDMIISVGYRVNSICGTRFRQWANQVLKEHMLKGFSVNQRLVSHENRLEDHDSRIINLEKQVDFFVKTNLPPSEGLLPAHAHWSGYEFLFRPDYPRHARGGGPPEQAIPDSASGKHARSPRPLCHRRRCGLPCGCVVQGPGKPDDSVLCAELRYQGTGTRYGKIGKRPAISSIGRKFSM